MARADAAKRLTIDDLKPYIREVEVVDWPGTDRKVGLMRLNCEELQQAYFAMREHFRRQGQPVDLFSQEEHEAEEMLQQVYRMLIDPSSKVADYRVFSSADQARKRLDAYERRFFCALHNELYPAEQEEESEE